MQKMRHAHVRPGTSRVFNRNIVDGFVGIVRSNEIFGLRPVQIPVSNRQAYTTRIVVIPPQGK